MRVSLDSALRCLYLVSPFIYGYQGKKTMTDAMSTESFRNIAILSTPLHLEAFGLGIKERFYYLLKVKKIDIVSSFLTAEKSEAYLG